MFKLFCLAPLQVLFASFVFCFSGGLAAQENELATEQLLDKHDFFDDESPLVCALEFDIRKFKREKSESKYQKAIFRVYESDTITTELEVKIKARGESRKKYCTFPPIKMKFGKEELADPYLDAINNQKLVTHCKSGSEFQQNLLKEYIVYKLYNHLTDFSYRTKLLQITYVDSQKKVKSIEKYAFVIEEEKIIAERNNAFYIQDDHLSIKHMDEDCMLRLSLFQFMIGNPDWSVSGLHNISLMKSKELEKQLPYAIPYDFDYTGFVLPVYSLSEENSALMSVEERTFKGICGEKDDYDKIIEQFNAEKKEFILTINDLDLLKANTRREMVNYIEEFYKLLNLPEFYQNYIIPNCKQ